MGKLKKKHFQVLGVLSYSIYLTHAWFISAIKSLSILTDRVIGYQFMYVVGGVRKIDFGFWINDFSFIPFLSVVIIFSSITYKFIEMRYQKKILESYSNLSLSQKSEVNLT